MERVEGPRLHCKKKGLRLHVARRYTYGNLILLVGHANSVKLVCRCSSNHFHPKHLTPSDRGIRLIGLCGSRTQFITNKQHTPKHKQSNESTHNKPNNKQHSSAHTTTQARTQPYKQM